MKPQHFFSSSLLILFLVFGIRIAFAQEVQVEGFGKGLVQRNYPHKGIPLLQNFYFRFTDGDRHIQNIQVKTRRKANKIALIYEDDTRDDEYFYKIKHRIIPITGIQTHKLTFINKGKETIPVSKPGPGYEFVLIGFAFKFHGDDHHIDEIGVLENNGLVTVFYNDRNDDDLFIVEIEYAWVPGNYFQSVGTEVGTKAKGAVKVTIPNGIPVIRGFRLNYEPHFTNGNDHHLKEIGILSTSTTSGDLEVYYSDKNQDDGFDWQVRWGILKKNINPFFAVVNVVDAFNLALTKRDTSRLDDLLHEDLIAIDSDGAVFKKDHWLDTIKRGVHTFKCYDHDSLNIRVADNTVVVSGPVMMTTKRGDGKQEISRDYQFTQVYSYNGKNWQVVSVQLTPLGV